MYPASSPKSYWKRPFESLGQDAGSAAIISTSLPSLSLWRRNGNAIPEKFEPPPKQAITLSGYSPAISICFSASRPITVWCKLTQLNTLPKTYLQFGVCIASSTASEIAQPKLPWLFGVSVKILRPALVDILGDAIT